MTSASALEPTISPPASLVLEVTETVMMADADIALARLRELKELGVRHRDGRLRHRLLVAQLPEPSSGRHPQDGPLVPQRRHDGSGLAAAIMAIGEQFGLEVVAEGIEHQEQIDSLQDLGFGLGQGFLFGKPMQATTW